MQENVRVITESLVNAQETHNNINLKPMRN